MKIKLIALCFIVFLGGCAETRYEKYSADFFDVFDTITVITGYETSREKFDESVSVIYGEMQRLHKLYDVYNEYPGINNVKTINDNAGIAPVRVDKDLLELIESGKKAYEETNGSVNIALGAVLKVWHGYREAAAADPDAASLPTEEELAKALAHTNVEDIVIDSSAGTVYLKDPEMSLDLGAIAKGYAVELAGGKARQKGLKSAVISAGGNVYTAGAPEDGRSRWSVGVQNPFAARGGPQLFDAVFLNDGAVVSSGDYQRFFVVDGVRYHHIIDPETAFPAQKYSGVTVVHPDSGIADMLSTAVFILPFEEGKALVEQFGGEAIWIFTDESCEATEGYREISRLYGAKQ